MASVQLDPSLPSQITVDFQSRHRASFRLFVRGPSTGGEWVFLKEGVEDTTLVAAPVPRGSEMQYEFIYFAELFPFRAVLVFRQNGQVPPGGGVVTVDAPGDAYLVRDQVVFR